MNSENNSAPNLKDLVELAQEAKRLAKSVRSEWHSKDPDGGRDPQFQHAAEILKQVIQALKERLRSIEPGGITEREMQAEAGDCFGVLGGLYRDWGKFNEAVSAYKNGRVSEDRIMVLGGKANSYCLVQELVNLILASSVRLKPGSALYMRIEKAQSEVNRQITTTRSGDPWAQADLALLTQLINPKEAAVQWDSFEDLNPPRFAFSATKEVVNALFEKLDSSMVSHVREDWLKTLERLS